MRNLILILMLTSLSSCDWRNWKMWDFPLFKPFAPMKSSQSSAHGGKQKGGVALGSGGNWQWATGISDQGPSLSGKYSVDKNGIIQGPNVYHQISKAKTSSKGFPGGKAKNINLHKTAGNTCINNGTAVPRGLEKPHIYICSNGNIIVNGTLDKPRTFAEAGHNSYTLNIEFESPYDTKANCKKRGEKTYGGYGNCYKPLTPAQIIAGREMMALMGNRHDIPLNLALPVKNESEFTAHTTTISNRGSANSRLHKSAKNLGKGIIISNWTKKGSKHSDITNHDDGVSWDESGPSKLNILGPGVLAQNKRNESKNLYYDFDYIALEKIKIAKKPVMIM